MLISLYNPVLEKTFEIKVSENPTSIDGLTFEPQMVDHDNSDEYAPFLSCTFSLRSIPPKL